MNDQELSTGSSQQQTVFQKLDAGLNFRLVLLIVSRTSIIIDFLRIWAKQRNCSGPFPVAWLTIQEEDNHPGCFLAHLSAAVAELDPENNGNQSEFWKEFSGTMQASSCSEAALDFTDRMIDLINHMSEFSQENSGIQDFFLVLRDYQRIKHPEIHAAVELLLDYLPPQMHLILTSFSEPPLQIPRLRVRRQLLELQESDFLEA
jgi:LuxR family maltose regulon positive regulatory protein